MKNRLIAHRGDMTTYPENSLLALRKAAELGFSYLELDIQFSKDVTPFVIHDENLVRTTGINKNIYETTTKELLSHSLLSPLDDNESKALLSLATLEKTIEELNNLPEITLFVEIKRQALDYLDLETVANKVLENLEYAKFKFVIISFVKEIIEYIQQKEKYATGWVVRKYDQVNQTIANDMQPDYLFCNVKKVNKPSELWQGSWKWALYDIKNPTFAYELLEQGVDLIETGDIMKLNNSEYFK